MKKLMMALAVITTAAAVQAASFDWKTSATGKIYEADTSTLLASGTAYILTQQPQRSRAFWMLSAKAKHGRQVISTARALLMA